MSSLKKYIEYILSNHYCGIQVADEIEKKIKDEAKKWFFKGKINDWTSFICEPLLNTSSEFFQSLAIQLNRIEGLDEQFIFYFHQSLQNEIETQGLERNLDSLLKLLNYEHLKSFIALFTTKG